MAAAFGPLNPHDQQRVYDQINALAQLGLSDQQIQQYLGQSRALGRSALDEYMNAAGMNIAQGFQPQFDQARNTLGANPLLAQSGYANRLNRQLLTDLAARESGAFNTAAADQAQGLVGYGRELQGQQIGLRSNLAGQGYNTILNPPQKQSFLGQLGGFVAKVGGAALGSYLKPSEQDSGGGAGSVGGGGLGAAGPSGYSQSGIPGGYSGYIPGQRFYPNYLTPPGGYSDPVASQYPTMMRRGGY